MRSSSLQPYGAGGIPERSADPACGDLLITEAWCAGKSRPVFRGRPRREVPSSPTTRGAATCGPCGRAERLRRALVELAAGVRRCQWITPTGRRRTTRAGHAAGSSTLSRDAERLSRHGAGESEPGRGGLHRGRRLLDRCSPGGSG
jgi:hypothetical protein